MSSFNTRQTGASLMEVLVAMSISLVVTASMVALMANSLGTTGRIVKMTKLADDLRVAMQMMTRDVRRSNFNGDSMFCFANDDCAALAGAIDIQNPTPECLTYVVDRDANGLADDAGGGFRWVQDQANDVGWIEMWVSDSDAAPDACADGASWVQVTNPADMNIFGFSVDDDLSYKSPIKDDGSVKVEQEVRKIRMSISGRLVMDPTIVRRIDDVISVRNDVLEITSI